MKLIRLIFMATFVGATFAVADLPKSLNYLISIDAARAVSPGGELRIDGNRLIMSDEEIKMRDAAVREALALVQLNPGAFVEFDALLDQESGKSPISAVELQEVIADYESLAGGKAVPKLISLYVEKSKVEALSPRQRILCYVMIKSSMRQMRANMVK